MDGGVARWAESNQPSTAGHAGSSMVYGESTSKRTLAEAAATAVAVSFSHLVT